MQSLSNESGAAPIIPEVKVNETSRMEMQTWYVSKDSHHPYYGRNSRNMLICDKKAWTFWHETNKSPLFLRFIANFNRHLCWLFLVHKCSSSHISLRGIQSTPVQSTPIFNSKAYKAIQQCKLRKQWMQNKQCQQCKQCKQFEQFIGRHYLHR